MPILVDTFDTERYRQLRKSSGLSQNEFARRAQLGESTIVRLDNGRKPSVVTLSRLSAALGVPSHELLHGPPRTLRELRWWYALSHAEAAEQWGVTSSGLNRVETGGRLHVDMAIAIARGTGMTVEEIRELSRRDASS